MIELAIEMAIKISIYRSEAHMQKEHKNVLDPTHCVVELNGFLFCIGSTRQFGKRYSNSVTRLV